MIGAPSIAIVGSGPAGFYAADALARKLPGAAIDILDRLPTPYGLVRGGVAPDHQGTKGVQRLFERSTKHSGLRFLGNVEVGRDVAYRELKEIYDAVVIATGAPLDRKLGIPGEELPGVTGSWRFVAWYNAHPGAAELASPLAGPAVAVIGNGNVAIDCVRVLAKTEAEMAKSDLGRHARAALAGLRIDELYLIGRRGPVEASFAPVELDELASLEACVPLVDGVALEREIAAADPALVKAKGKILDILRTFAANKPGTKPVNLRFVFRARPVAFLGGARLEAIELETPAGKRRLAVSSAITAIGYRALALDGMPFDGKTGIARNEGGRIEPGVYAVGWIARGPSGTIPTNRTDGIAAAERIAADLAAHATKKPGRAALDTLLAKRGARPVSFEQWKAIEAAEIARAEAGRPREKFTRVEEMLALCHGPKGSA
jgi:ferredoxin--NADP+ reductase